MDSVKMVFKNILEWLGINEPLSEETSVVRAQYLMKEMVKKWREVEIKIGVTGTSGVGKSSFINALRGLDDDDTQAAKTGVVGTASEPAFYPFPANSKIILVDLPESTSPTYPDIFELCDTFFILTATRFRIEEGKTAQKIRAMKKSFLLVRTKMDLDEENETRRKKRKIEDVIRSIRDDCLNNVKDLGVGEDEIFLVSNYDRFKWDFNRLVEAILNKLPTHQKEASIRPVMTKSKEFVRKKVEVWRGELWSWKYFFTLILFPLDIITLGFVSHLISTYLIKKKTNYYRSELGLPEEGSKEFMEMKQGFQKRMRRFYPRKEINFFAIYRQRIFNPIEIIVAAKSTRDHLDNVLTEMEDLSMELLDEAAAIAKQAIDEGSGEV